MRWSSLMAWMSVVRCNVFYGNDASPLPSTTKPPSALWLHLSAEKWLLTAPLRGEKIFSFPSTPSHPLRSFIFSRQLSLFIVAFPGTGMHQVWTCRFDGDGGDLNRPWCNSCARGTHRRRGFVQGIKSCGLEQCMLFVGHYACPYSQGSDLPSIRGVSHLFNEKTVRPCISFSLIPQISCVWYTVPLNRFA